MRFLQRLLVAGSALSIGVLGAQGIAGAQTGYPGTVVATDGTTTITVQTVGGAFSFTFCGFQPGSNVTESINGTAVKTLTAGSDGCISDTGVVSDPHLALGGTSAVAIAYGNNSVTASGTGTNGAAVTDALVVPVSATSSSGTGLAFTGADIMAMVIGGMALIATGFLILTFVRRRTAPSVS